MTTPNGLNPKSVTYGTELRLDSVADGLKTSVPAGHTTFLVGGTAYTLAELEKRLEEITKPWKTVRAAQAVIREAMATRADDERVALSFLKDLRMTFSTILGKQSEGLTKFGFKPEKARRALTPEELLVRAEKVRRTRELRGTKGRRQKEAIKAEGTAPIVIAPTGSVSPATPTVPTSNPSGVRTAI